MWRNKTQSFLTYLKYAPFNNSHTDYCGASGFIEKGHSIFMNKNVSQNDFDGAKDLVKNNYHIANGMDLYRFCILRSKNRNLPFRQCAEDRRCEKRIKRENNFVFSLKKQYFDAKTIDFSEKGLSINIFGEPQISAGDIINLSIEDHKIIAEIMWVHRLDNKSMVGLQRSN